MAIGPMRAPRRRSCLGTGALVVMGLVLAACGQNAGGAEQTLEPIEPTASTPASSTPATTTPAAITPQGDNAGSDASGSVISALPAPLPSALELEVVARLPHDPTAFTQGLEFGDDGRLYESRGRISSITEISPTTGEVIRSTPLRDDEFGEGLTIVDDRAVQITWQNQAGYVYDLETFEVVDTFDYQGEGWGICDDGDRLIMSDGTAELTVRDRVTFEAVETVTVTLNSEPIHSINELECVEGLVLANVWRHDVIVVIDPATGVIVSIVDTAGLLSETEAAQADVFNGIAYRAETNTFFVTGKLWPAMFEVRLVAAS